MSDPEDLLDIKEAASLLRVSETSLRRWTNSGALPHLRIGGKRERRFRRSDLLAFLDSTTVTRPPNQSSLGKHGSAVGEFVFGGVPTKPGTHVCGLSSSESARATQAAQFVEDALQAGSTCLVVTSADMRRHIMGELDRRVPSLDDALRTGRLIRSDYAESGTAQVDYFERELGRALQAGATSMHVIGDLSGGGPQRGVSFSRILDYEYEYDRRISKQFPVVTLCQYDANLLSGLEVLATLQAHPDALRYSPSRLLA